MMTCVPRRGRRGARRPRPVGIHHGVVAATAYQVTPLDVLDGFFGSTPELDAIRGLTLAQVDELGDRVRQSAEALALERAPADAVGELVYPGGWLARGWGQELFRAELNCSLLYEPRLLLHDPLAEYFFSDFDTMPRMRALRGSVGGISVRMEPSAWANNGRRSNRADDLDGIRADLARILRFLLDVEPLLRTGVIVMRSQWPTIRRRQQQLMASAKADMASTEMLAAARAASVEGGWLPKWDNLRGMFVTPPGGFLNPDDPALWQPEFFYLAKTLAVADAAGASYAPASPDEARLLSAKTCAVAARRGAKPGQPVLEEVLRVLVPDLDLDAATAVKIRESEEAFDDWRRALRDIQREAAPLESRADLRELVQDRLQPQVAAVSKRVSVTAALRSRAPHMVSAALLGTASNAVTGLTVGTSAAAAGLTGVAAWLWDAYRGRRPEGSGAVIAAMLRARP